MNKSGPIIIIEDDPDDQLILQDVFKDLQIENEVIYCTDGLLALAYLTKTVDQPFLILSDINMPKLDGLELREKIHNNEQLRLKCIPYLFFTTSAEQKMVVDAYSKSVQGFFVKPTNYSHLLHIIKTIIDYWKECQSPNVLA